MKFLEVLGSRLSTFGLVTDERRRPSVVDLIDKQVSELGERGS